MKSQFKKLLTCFLVIALLVSISLTVSAQTPLSDELFRQSLTQIREEYHIPGLAAVVLSSGGIEHIGVAGVRKSDSADSIQLEDRFHLGSNTKAMTAVLAAILVERNLIAWETPLFEIFPDLKPSSRDAYHEVTLRDLLSHRARIQPFLAGEEFAALPEFTGTIPERRQAFTAWLLQQEPVEIDPDTGFSYSNAGYAIVAAMLEKVSGTSWENLIQEEIFRPLEIRGEFGWPAIADSQQPFGHLVEQEAGIIPHDPHDEYQLSELIRPAGDVSMSIGDYAKFLQFNLAGLQGKDGLITSATLHFLHYANMDFSQYSMGWGSGQANEMTISSHDGSAGTFYCHVIVTKERDLGVAIVMNIASEEAIKGLYVLRKTLLTPYLN